MDQLSFFRTPTRAAELLFRREKFRGEIWEPCCGDGAISKVALAHGYEVYASDLGDYGYGDTGVNFLSSWRRGTNIVTNPPFRGALDFVEKALELASGKVALLLEQRFLVQRSNIFRGRLARYYPLRTAHFTSEPFWQKGTWLNPAWYVFEEFSVHPPTIHWF